MALSRTQNQSNASKCIPQSNPRSTQKKNKYSQSQTNEQQFGRTSPALMLSPRGNKNQKSHRKAGITEQWRSQHKNSTNDQLHGLQRDSQPMAAPPHASKKIEHMLQESEAEFRRRGDFKLIFPFRLASVSGSIFRHLYEDRNVSGVMDSQKDFSSAGPSQSSDLNACLLDRFTRKAYLD